MKTPTSYLRLAAEDLARDTSDAYMYGDYGHEAWVLNIVDLFNAGYNSIAVEWIVRSKIMRWANDYNLSPLDYINRYVGDAKLTSWMNDL